MRKHDVNSKFRLVQTRKMPVTVASLIDDVPLDEKHGRMACVYYDKHCDSIPVHWPSITLMCLNDL